ncbi:MAG: histidine kinase [Caldilineaceae bacterium]
MISAIAPMQSARNRLLEQQVAERTAALQESEERFRGLSTSAFEAILIQQASVIVDANEAATRLFGYAHGALVGLPIATLLILRLPATVADPAQVDLPDHYETEGSRRWTNHPARMHIRTIPLSRRRGTGGSLRSHRASSHRTATSATGCVGERNAFGRDLHDDLGQVMGYISMQAQTAQELLKQEKPVQAQGTLQELTEAA